ncbi:MAG TPA: hypothetical protein VL572_06860 [Pyrinomonadaceae bacterium]|nr:hypothetical protein [Pyrinomonadaceae bacterium]
MKVIKDQFALWLTVLFVSVAAIAIPMAASVEPVTMTVVKQREMHPEQQATNVNEDAAAIHDKDGKPAVFGRGVAWRQDYYDRRREYWEDRIDRRLDDEEFDDETGDDKDSDSKKDSKAAKDDKANKDDSAESDLDQEEEFIERRREYWRDRLDREW